MEKPEKITLPKGTFVYPKVITPDTKFKEEGEYSVKLRVKRNAPGVEALIKKLDAAAKASLQEAKEQSKTKAQANKWETKYLPYRVVEDDDGNETGEIEFMAKASATGRNKKTGEEWTKTIAVFDAKGNLITGKKKQKLNIGSGTVGRVSANIIPYAPTIQIGASVSLRLQAVQIINLVEHQGGATAEQHGFGEEDGFSIDDEDDGLMDDDDESEDKDEGDGDPDEDVEDF